MTNDINNGIKDKKTQPSKSAHKKTKLAIQHELDERGKTNARLSLSSPYPAARVIAELNGKRGGENNVLPIFERLLKNNVKVMDNNLEHLEELLLNQISALDSVFYYYMEQTTRAKDMGHLQAFGEIAFKAQKQCRVTVSALVELKNPRRATFIKQQNNAVNQQVNNDSLPTGDQLPKSGIFTNPGNELLEIAYEPVDTRETVKTITAYPPVEAVGKSQRSQNSRRKGNQ